jgi:hypothetical protein
MRLYSDLFVSVFVLPILSASIVRSANRIEMAADIVHVFKIGYFKYNGASPKERNAPIRAPRRDMDI